MWAIDMTDVFVFCKFTPSVTLRVPAPSSEGAEKYCVTSHIG